MQRYYTVTTDSGDDFYSRTSCEVQRCVQVREVSILISTHAPLARCNVMQLLIHMVKEISTHAPLARCNDKITKTYVVLYISTHAPLARCNLEQVMIMYPITISTHAPLARCNFKRFEIMLYRSYFYSRTSCEVQQADGRCREGHYYFYSRTSCEVQL